MKNKFGLMPGDILVRNGVRSHDYADHLYSKVIIKGITSDYLLVLIDMDGGIFEDQLTYIMWLCTKTDI